MEFGTHFTRTEVFSQILHKNIVPIAPYFFNTHIEKHIFMNFTSLGSQKGLEPLRYNQARSSQNGVAKKFLNKTNMKIFLILCPLKNIQ